MDVIVNYFNSLSEDDRQLVKHYTHEIDVDDWTSSPLKICYEVINYILKQRYIPKDALGYKPDLVKERVLSEDEIQQQICNAQRLQSILSGFPPIQDDIEVYRGFVSKDVFFEKTTHLLPGDEITVPYFLSTSLSFHSASRFTNRNKNKCYWRIEIPKGFPIPLIKDSVDNINVGMEDEVLLNIGAVLKCTKNVVLDDYSHVITFTLKGYSKATATRGYWDTIQEIGSELYT